ncbi:dihydropteroate synthase [Treponema sp.]|uniref:dihydropteroate synthase n=1 Tax=Treponema sp. TaxID=166 RepID=UPI0025E36AD0|nr:dihydropteroate synthase [Treponema sp.]MCR5218111.1 dihydropteroate synthase [Treponema sp.]
MKLPELNLSSRTITSKNAAFVMGIVNCNEDSFFSGSRGGAERAFLLEEEGADIIDLGAESTRPGSRYISEEEELSRLIPVIKEIRKKSSIPLSIDTRRKSVMEAAFNEGADMLNDISALEDDPALAAFAAEKKIPVFLMHKRGIPSEMQSNTSYENVFREVDNYLKERVEYALSQGIDSSKIIVDPGIGFGKDLEANKILTARCGELCGGKYPVLMALSRKSYIGLITGRKTEDRLYGTIICNFISMLSGASYVRVHDVAPCVDMLAVLKSFRESGLL